jgi:hypothetical protein
VSVIALFVEKCYFKFCAFSHNRWRGDIKWEAIMRRRVDFFNVIGNFNKSLGNWQDKLERVTPDTPYSKAAQIHVRRCQDWIRPILDNPDYAKTIEDENAIKYLKKAVIVIEMPKAEKNLANTCGAIDQALKCTYTVVRASVGQKGFTKKGFMIGEPATYDKELSILPGTPDFPTDSTIDPSAAKSKSFLPGPIKILHGRKR